MKVTLSIVDSAVLTAAQYQFNGNTYTPNWDMFMWYWTQDVDPAFMVSIYTPPQSTGYGWNDCLWTDPAYTKLSNEAATTIDQAQRIPIVQQAQKIFYYSAPYAIMAYPYQLEAWNTNKWTGWTKAPAGNGAAIYNYNNIDTYKNLAPERRRQELPAAAKRPHRGARRGCDRGRCAGLQFSCDARARAPSSSDRGDSRRRGRGGRSRPARALPAPPRPAAPSRRRPRPWRAAGRLCRSAAAPRRYRRHRRPERGRRARLRSGETKREQRRAHWPTGTSRVSPTSATPGW